MKRGVTNDICGWKEQWAGLQACQQTVTDLSVVACTADISSQRVGKQRQLCGNGTVHRLTQPNLTDNQLLLLALARRAPKTFTFTGHAVFCVIALITRLLFHFLLLACSTNARLIHLETAATGQRKR